MFEALTEKLQAAFRAFRSKGALSEADIKAGLRQVRLALLEADVNLQVVKAFTESVQRRAVGEEVMKSLTPGQQVVKIVHEELVSLLRRCAAEFTFSPVPPTKVLMLGLQGGGKTTTCAKLALWAKQRGHNPLLVATDLRRPAAIQQLQVVGSQVGCPVFAIGNRVSPLDVARGALEHARAHGYDVIIVDTQGRLHTDPELLQELRDLHAAVQPTESLLVLDAMTGQEAVRVATDFANAVPITGFALTKLDGDARGGAALSVGFVTQRPIKLVGMGERLEALEPFHPERIANRILGMGDVLTLIERAQQTLDQQKLLKVQERLASGELNLEDFLEQMRQLRRMGPLEQVLSLIPGLSRLPQGMRPEVDERELTKMEAIVLSMTPEERRNPEIIGSSRRKRIAAGSGSTVADVNALLKEFKRMRKAIRQAVAAGGKLRREDFARLLFG